MTDAAGERRPLYVCPVCDYDKLDEPPARYFICPQCGTEFENDDAWVSHAELRRRWIASGRKWWSIYDDSPTKDQNNDRPE